ncbi:SMP-30/gluconolactonase/LRE family protein [Streptomyces sp. SS52]|uniref:SMP-30/gluconolactonase/LRE family protein n=1 Tax=Streptomyces sp. SS52 TaxID=2563602 RepID=UPI0032B54493
MTVDAEGALWTAVWGAGEVRRYLPDGSLATVLRLPVSRPAASASAVTTDAPSTSRRPGWTRRARAARRSRVPGPGGGARRADGRLPPHGGLTAVHRCPAPRIVRIDRGAGHRCMPGVNRRPPPLPARPCRNTLRRARHPARPATGRPVPRGNPPRLAERLPPSTRPAVSRSSTAAGPPPDGTHTPVTFPAVPERFAPPGVRADRGHRAEPGTEGHGAVQRGGVAGAQFPYGPSASHSTTGGAAAGPPDVRAARPAGVPSTPRPVTTVRVGARGRRGKR